MLLLTRLETNVEWECNLGKSRKMHRCESGSAIHSPQVKSLDELQVQSFFVKSKLVWFWASQFLCSFVKFVKTTSLWFCVSQFWCSFGEVSLKLHQFGFGCAVSMQFRGSFVKTTSVWFWMSQFRCSFGEVSLKLHQFGFGCAVLMQFRWSFVKLRQFGVGCRSFGAVSVKFR